VDNTAVQGKLSELDWLIGKWSAEEHGSRIESVCSWIANKSFIQRTYMVTLQDCKSSDTTLKAATFSPGTLVPTAAMQ
jgi:hypothetical protein